MNIVKEGRTVPRKGHTQKRDVLADPIYNNKVVTKLINNIGRLYTSLMQELTNMGL